MNMPTVCDCGEIVELDGMRAISKELYCNDCYYKLKEETEGDDRE